MGEIVIDGSHDGKTVKDYIRSCGISRAELIRLKKREDGILLNGERATVRAVLKTGDLLYLSRDDKSGDENPFVEPIDLGLVPVFENDGLLAFCKPAGMPTHPSHNHLRDTLANGAAYVFSQRGIPFVFRACNRLDRDTSGIVVIAKNKGTAKYMSELISSGGVEKTYVCIAEGVINEELTVNRNIKRREPSIIERCVCPDNEGQTALTRVFPVFSGAGMTLCRIKPETGRTHQIRVHLASVSHPVAGDTLYGNASPYIGRQALHCSEMKFPFGGEDVVIRAPLPGDMAELVKLMKGNQ
ncbi:MAG: RluA family pseudouridine synthase [Clostridia bacterium]|nr:RluA family pseudouridine synthase [Clostridia bacterium]